MPKSKMPTKAIDIIIISIPSIAFLILLLSPSSESSGCLGCFLKKKKESECGNNVKISYISDFERPNESRKICLVENRFNPSPLSEIYSGWFSDDEDKRRIAIKKYNMKEDVARRAYANSVHIFRKIKESFPDEAEQKLLINAVDWSIGKGKFFLKRKAMIVMELAGEDFYTHLRENEQDFAEGNIRDAIKMLAQPLELFHREVGIHLDVKPGNYLYDETGDFLKLIDFDGSQAFPADVPSGREERANAAVKLSKIVHWSEIYVSPELKTAIEENERNGRGNGAVTTKSDIWSLGMSIYDVLLYQKRYRLIDKRKLHKMRNSLPILFRELSLSNPPTIEDTGRIIGHLDTLEELFKIWNDFPASFQLLNNLLNPDDPAARMSARGVVNFTEGGCRPKMRVAEGNDDDDIVLFNHVTASSLLKVDIQPHIHGEQTANKMLELQGLLTQALSKKSELMANTNYGALPECQTN